MRWLIKPRCSAHIQRLWEGRAEGDEGYYSVRKNKGLTYGRRRGGAAANVPSCSFLMCFSLPESNSFPGPRQLHINWPRRQCQDYSVQVLRRCHRQLNIDLEVCSSCFPLRYLASRGSSSRRLYKPDCLDLMFPFASSNLRRILIFSIFIFGHPRHPPLSSPPPS